MKQTKQNKGEVLSLNLLKANKIFKASIVKVRPEDLYSLAEANKKILSPREYQKMINASDELFKMQEGTDYLAKIKGRRISFTRF